MSADDWGQFKVTLAAASSAAKLIVCQLRGLGDEGDDAGAEPVDDAPFLQQLGVAARPVVRATLRAVGLRHGDEAWLFKLFDKSKQPAGLEAGEVRLYGLEKVAAAVRILATGVIRIDAEPGQDVVVNGGAAKVHREGDNVSMGTFVFVPGSGGASLTWTPPGGGAGVPITTGSVLTGKAAGGASNFKA